MGVRRASVPPEPEGIDRGTWERGRAAVVRDLRPSGARFTHDTAGLAVLVSRDGQQQRRVFQGPDVLGVSGSEEEELALAELVFLLGHPVA